MTAFLFQVPGVSEEVHNNIHVLILNQTDAPHNRITLELGNEIRRWHTFVTQDKSARGMVIMSKKPGCFLAGVDVTIFDTIDSAAAAEQAARDLQSLFGCFAHGPLPTVAAVDGVCLGGGMEWALACQARICSSDPRTQWGLPEVQLGLLPGAGGTQRLPRLIGLTDSFEIILSGKKINAKKALKLGLVSDVVPPDQLKDRAIALCEQLHKKPRASAQQKSLTTTIAMAAQESYLGRKLLEQKVKETLQEKTKGHYPAPFKALEVMLRGIALPLPEALELEAKAFGTLFDTPQSRALRYVFAMMNAGKKNPFPKDIQTQGQNRFVKPLTTEGNALGIVGAGFMGSGIASNALHSKQRVVLLDRTAETLQRGAQQVDRYFTEQLNRKRIKRHEWLSAQYRLQPSLTPLNLRGCSLIIEAVFEELSVKHDTIKKCEAAMGTEADFIFASNTSSIPIAEIAAASAKPAQVVGMHFFSPVPKMPFVEVIKGPQTAPEVASAVVDIALALGKHVIVVEDGPGFYTTRILAFLIAEALNLVAEGASVEDIDAAMQEFGMAVGPLTLLDEVGIDVGAHIVTTLKKSFGDRLVIPECITDILAEKRLGRKNGKGFYVYEADPQAKVTGGSVTFKKGGVDPTVYKHFTSRKSTFHLSNNEMRERIVSVFVNEAGRCLEEKIIATPLAGDLGAVFGLGFPPFRGGPFFYAQQLGLSELVNRLKTLESLYGSRFSPSSTWKTLTK